MKIKKTLKTKWHKNQLFFPILIVQKYRISELKGASYKSNKYIKKLLKDVRKGYFGEFPRTLICDYVFHEFRGKFE